MKRNIKDIRKEYLKSEKFAKAQYEKYTKRSRVLEQLSYEEFKSVRETYIDANEGSASGFVNEVIKGENPFRKRNAKKFFKKLPNDIKEKFNIQEAADLNTLSRVEMADMFKDIYEKNEQNKKQLNELFGINEKYIKDAYGKNIESFKETFAKATEKEKRNFVKELGSRGGYEYEEDSYPWWEEVDTEEAEEIIYS